VCVRERERGWQIEYETVAGSGAITRQRLAAAVTVLMYMCVSGCVWMYVCVRELAPDVCRLLINKNGFFSCFFAKIIMLNSTKKQKKTIIQSDWWVGSVKSVSQVYWLGVVLKLADVLLLLLCLVAAAQISKFSRQQGETKRRKEEVEASGRQQLY